MTRIRDIGSFPISVDELTGELVVRLSGSTVGSDLTFETVAINAGADASTAVVTAGGTGEQVWVYAAFGTLGAAGTVVFEDSDGTDLTGAMTLDANGGLVLPISPNANIPWIAGTTNKGLNIRTTGGTFDGSLTYAYVTP